MQALTRCNFIFGGRDANLPSLVSAACALCLFVRTCGVKPLLLKFRPIIFPYVA